MWPQICPPVFTQNSNGECWGAKLGHLRILQGDYKEKGADVGETTRLLTWAG